MRGHFLIHLWISRCCESVGNKNVFVLLLLGRILFSHLSFFHTALETFDNFLSKSVKKLFHEISVTFVSSAYFLSLVHSHVIKFHNSIFFSIPNWINNITSSGLFSSPADENSLTEQHQFATASVARSFYPINFFFSFKRESEWERERERERKREREKPITVRWWSEKR